MIQSGGRHCRKALVPFESVPARRMGIVAMGENADCTENDLRDREPSGTPASPSMIEVRAPYCALSDVRILEPGVATALVIPEQEVDLEVGPVAAAEAGRHLAILGSYACASSGGAREGRHYYLAEEAQLEATDLVEESGLSGRAPLRVLARVTSNDKRRPRAACEIHTLSGARLYSLSVGYNVVPERVFQRLFAAHRVDMRRERRGENGAAAAAAVHRRNPYRRRLPLTIEHVDGRTVRAALPCVNAEDCSGHFPLYPAIPVAVLMEVFSNAAGALLRQGAMAPSLRYRVRRAEIRASKLVFAGQGLVLSGETLEPHGELGALMRMRAWAADGHEVADATFVLEGCRAATHDQVFGATG